jgi:von Willebrand factor type A domain.
MLFRKFLEKFRLPRLLNSLIHDRSGNFGIMTALLLPCLLGAAGVALDLAGAMATKQQMAEAADAGALAAASALGEKKATAAEAKKLAEEFVRGQFAGMGMTSEGYKIDVDVKTTTQGGKTRFDVDVSVDGDMPTTLTRIMGFESVPISVASAASSGIGTQNSMSMYLVLDRSGSMEASVTTSVKSTTSACDYYYLLFNSIMMTKRNQKPCYYQRIEILKTAVARLVASLAEADPDRKYIRTGAAAFSTDIHDPKALNWGTQHVAGYVEGLTAEGGTSSTGAFDEAVKSLMKQSEDSAHTGKNGLKPLKYILFMTDGENNDGSDNRDTLNLCTKAKNAGITIYTVGFMLSSNTAKNLLQSCASSAKTYYDAQDGEKLTAAFSDIAKATTGAIPLLTR